MDLNKASVFNEKNSKEILSLFKKAEKAGMKKLRTIELEIIEKDPFN